MGLFGDLDASDVSADPFYVAPDKYRCVLTEAKKVEKKDGSGWGLSFKWVIDDEESDYYQNSLSDWKDIFPDLTPDDVTTEIKRKMSFLKSRLYEMGLSDEEMETLLDDDNLDELVGMVAYVEVVETTDKNDPDKKYSNIRKVIRLDSDE